MGINVPALFRRGKPGLGIVIQRVHEGVSLLIDGLVGACGTKPRAGVLLPRRRCLRDSAIIFAWLSTGCFRSCYNYNLSLAHLEGFKISLRRQLARFVVRCSHCVMRKDRRIVMPSYVSL